MTNDVKESYPYLRFKYLRAGMPAVFIALTSFEQVLDIYIEANDESVWNEYTEEHPKVDARMMLITKYYDRGR